MNAPYAELHCISNFTFLRGASHPEELVARAARLGYAALALTDECSLAGAVRAHRAACEHGLHFIVGSELRLDCGLRCVLLAPDRAAYGRLARLITLGRRQAGKGAYRLSRADFAAHRPDGCLALWLPPTQTEAIDAEEARWLAQCFPGATWIAVELLLSGDDAARCARLTALGASLGLPLCAAGAVHMHSPGRRRLQDTLTAIRLGRPVAELGRALFPNGERHLRPRRRLADIYPAELLAETLSIARRCRFRLDELRYEYPRELVPEGHTPASRLRGLTLEGLQRRWPGGAPPRVHRLIEHELALVRELGYEPYFLTVHDIVRFARSRGILCQGRGSAANSAVCYCLGITEVDPDRTQLLFERFVSKERDEPPDIDVDFEHERREEVIQYIYSKYGRERAALAATVITYRERSAARDVGKALGMSLDQIDGIARDIRWWDGPERLREQLARQRLRADSPVMRLFLQLVPRLIGFPRHLSQHVGGFVISQGPLCELVPIENAAMPERTVIQWEKDDLEALGLLKIDVLALGMLTALRKALGYIERYPRAAAQPMRPRSLAEIPPEDPAVYAMIQQADTIGVFQIESRAQMSMLPRLRPRSYYDLVIQVAIIRPGPIQGEMVHPYLARRHGREAVTYPSEAVKQVLERTLGVPIFQEQVMQLVMVAAGFSPGEADQLRRCMGTWRQRGGFERFHHKLMDGMRANGYPQRFAEQIYQQIQGFGEYGFPECVTGETRVIDADSGRWLTIDEIMNGSASLKRTIACDENLRLRPRKVLEIRASGTKSVFRLRTALGHTICATAEHPFLTMNGWRRLGDLKKGDYIAAARAFPSLGRRRWPRHRIIVLAGLIAEGNLCHPSTFYFYTKDPRYRDEFASAVERFPNTESVVDLHKGCFSVRVRRIDRKRLSSAVIWLKKLGVWGRGAREKHLPAEIFELRDSDLALLLARLWEGDGGFSKSRHASYETASRRLAEEIQHLLLRLGIVARLYHRIRPYKNRTVESFVVTVTGEALQRFWRSIGRRFLSPEKRRQARALAISTGARTSLDVIPAHVRTIIRCERDKLRLTWNAIGRTTGLCMREIQARVSNKGGFRRSVIARLAECFASAELKLLAESDLYWDKVVMIEPLGQRPTYDLQIADDHNFLANNLVVHNSHSASFALLAYASAWIKRHYPAAFTCALLNSQPMGFYAPAQLVRDARRHGVEVRPVDVNASDGDCTLEWTNDEAPALRLGLRLVKGLSDGGIRAIMAARAQGPFLTVTALAARAALAQDELDHLAAAGALRGLGGDRHRAYWQVRGVAPPSPLFPAPRFPEAEVMLRRPREGEDITADYATLGLTLGRHPLALLRPELEARRYRSAEALSALCDGTPARAAGLVICRQRPHSAKGVIFVTLEDETGQINVIVWQRVVERDRRALLDAVLLGVQGKVQQQDGVMHLVAHRLEDLSAMLGRLRAQSRDFC